jgi:peptide/nickel transport system substrate-binding protein
MLKEDGIAFDLTGVDKIEITGERTIVFTLSKPLSTFISQLSEIGIVPKDIYDDNYSQNPISSGPYQVVQYNDGQQIIMEYNQYWYGQEPPFKKLTFLLLGEDAAFAAAKAGQVDIVYVPPRYAKETIEGMTLHILDSVDARGITMPVLPKGNRGKINANDVAVGNDVTSDLAIRQALNIGLSRQSIIDITMDGYGKPSYSIVDGTPWFNEETIHGDGLVEEAKQILADAGWVDTNNDGIVEKNGLKAEFDMLYPSNDQLRGDITLAAADAALEFGIKINALGATWDEIFVRGKENACAWGGGRLHPHQLYTMYASDHINVGYYNLTHYSNPVTDRYLDQAMGASTQEAANKYWKLAQWDGKTGFSGLGDVPMIWLARVDHLYFVNDKVNIGDQILHIHGYEFGLFGNITEWTLNE